MTVVTHPYRLTHLKELEAESIYVIREVAAQFERPALLFSGGKDSIVLSHLARKAFWPAKIPFPLLHIDTGHNFPETLTYRDWWVEKIGAKLLVRSVQDSIDQGRAVEEKGFNASRNMLQTVTLLDAMEELKLDAALGGGRRDEEKARAKERFFSHRDEFGQWDPKNQRPELWNLFNGKKHIGEHFRVFPISNWTEMDVWQYILQEKIELPSLYFTHQRDVIDRDGVLLADSDYPEQAPRRDPADGPGPLPHHRRHDLHRRRPLPRHHGGRDHPGGRRLPHHRARHPRRRQALRSRHGRPQKGRLLLDRHDRCTGRLEERQY